ncbi:MAG TPA: PAS domain S-box protein [Silvibacterium sp.]|nr:PAS domain S-box protein [Silvibacterium sp.]
MSKFTERSDGLERKLDLVVKTGRQLTNDLDLKSILQAAIDAGLELCGAQFGVFSCNVADASGESCLLYALSGVDREQFSRFSTPRNTAVFAPTFKGTAIVRSGDITNDPRYGHNLPFHGMPKGHLPVRSYLAVPVKSQSGEVLGGLFYGHQDVNVFDQRSQDLVGMVAALAAVAIENTRLRDELTRRLADLQKVQFRQKEAAKHLSELAAIVESSDDAILSKDLNGIITSWNEAATRILGYSSDEMIGESILKLIPKELHGDEAIILAKIRSGQRIEHFETVRLTKSGKRLDVSLTVSPVRDETGQIIGASKTLRDISSRKRIETSLLQAEKIAATGRMAATIAHEINNPLEAVMNLLYLLRPMVNDPAGSDYLSAAEDELGRVSHIARQTLGYYREHAAASLASLSELARHTITVYEPRCEASHIKIEKDLQSSAKVMVRRGEMMQVISNLIANAIYAMQEGGILWISVTDAMEPQPGVILTISDNGSGISAEHIPRIFEAFFTTRDTIGTGIGLFVAKQFVEGHGGRIEVQSSTDPVRHGTSMSIFLPLSTAYSGATGDSGVEHGAQRLS